jgi:hypothetical protein
MRLRFLGSILLLWAWVAAQQSAEPPDVPANLKVANSERLVLHAHASGHQIYVCQKGPDQKPAWSLKAPDATLFDTAGKAIGKHYLGPTWQHSDGSKVKGKVVAKQEAPDASSIPWLLLRGEEHSGTGVFENVTSIQRINTRGGLTPAAETCTEATLGSEKPITYSADYYFYASDAKSSRGSQ